MGASQPEKRPDAAFFAALARELIRRGLTPVLLGGPAEVELGAAVAHLVKAPIANLCGRLGLGALAVLGQELALLVTPDTGPMGKTIEATGTAVSLSEGTATKVSFTLAEDSETCIVNVLDSSGEIVRTVDLGATAAGTVDFTWDGKDYDGNTCDDGLYQVAVTATNADGDTLTVSSTMLPPR